MVSILSFEEIGTDEGGDELLSVCEISTNSFNSFLLSSLLFRGGIDVKRKPYLRLDVQFQIITTTRNKQYDENCLNESTETSHAGIYLRCGISTFRNALITIPERTHFMPVKHKILPVQRAYMNAYQFNQRLPKM
ncbi:17297_t:CDS:2 [Acaulospora colombiana]|uniref:17297_t:CDS:1 n=1 Tax=Acaulospora colombiana TaxID=27376 RepID=A0ACA9KVK6_9GLOM|nr:17297_t:CDS:2 [Acaulospora colombiana]